MHCLGRKVLTQINRVADRPRLPMSAFGGKADMGLISRFCDLRRGAPAESLTSWTLCHSP